MFNGHIVLNHWLLINLDFVIHKYLLLCYKVEQNTNTSNWYTILSIVLVNTSIFEIDSIPVVSLFTNTSTRI